MDFVWSLDFMQYLSMAKFRDTSLKEIIEIEFQGCMTLSARKM
jgi:hypothetical protein